jgi:DNA-binding MarR family transcriptional regulator
MDRETASRTDDHQALRLWLRLLTCSQLIEREVRARLQARFDTTLPRFDLMSQLWRYPDGLKMNELSRHLMVTGGNVTGVVDPLEKDGLVERTPEPADRRAYRVRLTRAGRKAFAEMARAHEGWVVEMLGGLTRKEQAQTYRLLARMKQVTMEAGS